MTKYEKFYVLKDLFAIDKANDELFRLVGVAICMAIPLLIGYFSIIYSLGPLARWAFIRLFIISRFLCLNYCAD